MSNIYQQNFVPASMGLIKSAPSSLIPDGAFQETVNVRFGDGYVEKVNAFTKISKAPEKIIGIRLFRKSNGSSLNMIHTRHGLYNIRFERDLYNNLIVGDYEVPNNSHISSCTSFDNYYFTSLGTDIYYYNEDADCAKKLEGTYSPDEWKENTNYSDGDIIRPTNDNYSGYIYKCIKNGQSGSSEPTWEKDLSTEVIDGSVKWVGVGSLELEGSSASELRALFLESYKGFLFVANTEEDGKSYPYRLRWS